MILSLLSAFIDCFLPSLSPKASHGGRTCKPQTQTTASKLTPEADSQLPQAPIIVSHFPVSANLSCLWFPWWTLVFNGNLLDRIWKGWSFVFDHVVSRVQSWVFVELVSFLFHLWFWFFFSFLEINIQRFSCNFLVSSMGIDFSISCL